MNNNEIRSTRLILKGDKELAATHAGDAKHVLAQLGNIQQTGPGGKAIQTITKQFLDGTVIKARTDVKGLNIVEITSGRFFDSKEEQKKKTKEVTIRFPVPVIGVTDNYETLEPIGGYVAKNFIGFMKEYCDKYKEEYIEKYYSVKKGVSYGTKGHGNGTVELKSLMAVGNHDDFSHDLKHSGSYSHSYIRHDYVSDHSITGECSGEYGIFTVDFAASDAPVNAPIPVAMGTQVGNDDPNRYNGLNCNTSYVFSPAESFDYIDIWGDFFFYGCCLWALPPWTCTKVVSTPQIGIYASGSWEYSVTGAFSGASETSVTCGAWTKEGVLSRDGNGVVSVDCMSGLMVYSSNTVDSGFMLDGLDGATWKDPGGVERMACLYELNDQSHSYSYSGGDSSNPGRIGIVCGDLDHWDHSGHRIQYYFKTDEDEFLINDLSYFDYEWAYGTVEIFDYSGSPVYIYQIYYTFDYSTPEGSVFEYGFVYNRKIHRIKFDGVGDGSLDYSEWAHSLLKGTYTNPDGEEKAIEMPKEIAAFYGGVIDYPTYDWSKMQFMVSEYTITEQREDV